ncbi:NAD(P)-dependent oxidoreductase [Bacteroides fragilis]|uniref:NAD-dependent epimerase/dehydratase family protein n=1 Tax=Bacteroides fragilis TaxID=817 RepID=UPI0004473B72|nr:NAD(P)-dependent oxidoreductase [Bacteroides fragilis]EXZ99993.1 polysaccharide biosynthesis family protein [Bacteroides fragilis str. S23 R14]EYA66063.1 polysaccharide biosynthesis family protein [Bacteroides fragilis str. S23L24]EYE44382.1 polysaccharide biosynthesis family protein [Bacteroides fragilis str. S23L17]MCE9273184.1 NAD(P)-dependent oxidoreductase [Bacteroides fragilis]MCE9305421.1 NAD(P)-dependent oxidoreductase [Bacteroides fragilis]
MKRTCVITGATGYIGSHLVHYLLDREWEIFIILRENSNYKNIERIIDRINIFIYTENILELISFFKRSNPTVVFHLAAAVYTNCKSEQIPALIQSNILFGTQILEAMRYSSTRLFINTGTYWQNYNSDEYNPVDLYAATKEAFEKILKYYVDAFGIRVITLRLYDVYGEDDKRPKLLNLLKEIADTERSIDVSPGEQYLDMVYISDVCSAYLQACELLYSDRLIENEIYGVYTGEKIRLKELIELFSDILKCNIKVNLGKRAYKNREVMEPMEHYQCLPQWRPAISLQEGLQKFNKR